MKVTYSPRAVADLRSIAAYLKPRSPQGAANVQAAIRRTVAQLEHFPGLGTPQKTQGVRKLVVRKYPYLVFYVVAHADEVSIVTIQHASRDREFTDA